MLFIALTGGTAAERENIAAGLVTASRGNLLPLANDGADVRYQGRRAKHLAASLAAQEEQRARSLGAALEQGKSRWRQGLVVVHCLTEREAALVRERDGVIWHLYSRPSQTVVIRNGDPMVTDGENGFGHVLSPLEALSELLLARGANGRP